MSRRIAWLPLVAMMAAGPAVAAPSSQQNEQANRSVFTPNEPVKPYAVQGGGNETAGAAGHTSYAPNAGQTGLNGSGGTSSGWTGTAPGKGNGQ